MLPHQNETCKMTVLACTIAVPAQHLDALHRALEEAASEAQAPYYPYEQTFELLAHLRLVWEWSAQIEGGRLCHLLPDRDYVDIGAMERMFRVLAPHVEAPAGGPCVFAYREDTEAGEAYRYLLVPGQDGKPETARVIVQRGELHWLPGGSPAPRRDLLAVLADIAASLRRMEEGWRILTWAKETALSHGLPEPTEAGDVLAYLLHYADLHAASAEEMSDKVEGDDELRADAAYCYSAAGEWEHAASLRELAVDLLLLGVLPTPIDWAGGGTGREKNT
jgi:hypothetical protein